MGPNMPGLKRTTDAIEKTKIAHIHAFNLEL